jgi:pimeloyl-ACP methyl ester carboxylesterase
MFSSLAFHPHVNGDTQGGFILIEGGRIHVRVFPGAHPTNILLYSYGNEEDVASIAPKIDLLVKELNTTMVTYNYPGYGASTGEANESTVHQTIVSVYDWIRERLPSANIFVWGRSIGTGPTTYVASQRPVHGVILESGPLLRIR